MERFTDDLKKIKENLRGVRDDEIRRKARLLIRVMESRDSVRMACDRCGICPKTFYAWLNRLRRKGHDLEALQNKSRRPRTSPRQLSAEIEDRLCELRKSCGDAGGRVVAFAYLSETGEEISHSVADKVFARRGLVKKARPIKRNLHKKRYASPEPLDRVQFDTVWLSIEDSDGNRVYAVDAVDCCSRMAFAHTVREQGSSVAYEALGLFLESMGTPKLIQTDNGVEFTNRFSSELNAKREKEARPGAFENRLAQLGIRHHLIKPRTPQLNGKIERFHRTLLRWISSRNLNGRPFPEIEKAVSQFVQWYNHKRPHSAINYLPPATVFYQIPQTRTA